MQVSQLDIAHLEDADIRELAVATHQLAQMQSEPLRAFLIECCKTLMWALNERSLAVAVFDTEMLNVHDEGGLVGPDDDPVGDALRELRGDGGGPM